VEPVYGNRRHQRMQSPHHLRAKALATTHSLSLSNLTDETSTTSCGSTTTERQKHDYFSAKRK